MADTSNAPERLILLTDAKTLTPSTAAELKALAPKTITLIGGTAVISQAIENELKATYGAANVVRYGGYDQYETAALIAKALGTTGKAIIVSGNAKHYADALSISSYAAYNGIPILFNKGGELPTATKNALASQQVKETIVVGGTAVVPASVYKQLPQAVRYEGIDQYETASLVAQGLNYDLKNVYVATGLGFADALVAGNLAAHTLSPILLVDKGVPKATSTFLKSNKAKISNLILVGGEAVITPIQRNALNGVVK